MAKTAIILRVDSELKDKAQNTADQLGISMNAVICNELRRFAAEKDVIFCMTTPVNQAQTHQWLKLRLPRKTVGRFGLLAGRLGLPVRNLMEAELRQAADRIPGVSTESVG